MQSVPEYARQRSVARGDRHRCLHPGPRRCTPVLAVLRGAFSTIALVWATAATQDGWSGGAKQVFALRIKVIKWIPGSTGFHVRPHVWVVERSFA